MDLKLPERVAVLEICYKNLKQDLFGGDGKRGAFPGLEDKVANVEKLFTNHLAHLKEEQEKRNEEFKKEQGKWSRRKFDVLKMVIDGIIGIGVLWCSWKLTGK